MGVEEPAPEEEVGHSFSSGPFEMDFLPGCKPRLQPGPVFALSANMISIGN